MNPIFLEIGPVQIYWYSIFILIAFVIGGLLAFKEAKKFNISSEFMTNMAFYLIPLVLIGARLYYVLFNLDYYLQDPITILKVWEGGLAIHGGIITGLLFILFYTRKYKVSFVRMLDILVVSLILGQAIGRWGNFFNGEAYGPIVTLEFLQNLKLPEFIIDGMLIRGNYHHPTFLYESLWCLLGFIIMIILRYTKFLRLGQLTSFYLVWYGLERLIVEGLRTDSLMFGNIKVAQLISLGMIVIGIILFIIIKIKSTSSENRYNDKGNATGDKIN